MSETQFVRKAGGIKVVAATLGVIAALFGSFQALITLPVRVDGHEKRLEQHEKKMEQMETAERANREILIRIEEQVKQMREDIKRKTL